jgi:hypothetical protein
MAYVGACVPYCVRIFFHSYETAPIYIQPIPISVALGTFAWDELGLDDTQAQLTEHSFRTRIYHDELTRAIVPRPSLSVSGTYLEDSIDGLGAR